MSKLSVGVQLAWQIAASEAVQAKHQFIEAEHIFIGLCGLEKMIQPKVLDQLNDPEESVKALQAEWDVLKELFTKFHLNPTTLRRELRQRKGEGNFEHKENPVHRSPHSRQAFERAGILSQESKAAAVDVTHLLVALLEDDSGAVFTFLREKGVDVRALKQQALTMTIITIPLSEGRENAPGAIGRENQQGIRGKRGSGEKEDKPPLLRQLRVAVTCLPTFNHSLVHCDIPFLSEVTVFNNGNEPLKSLELQIALSGYAKSQPITIRFIPAKGGQTINPLPRFLFDHLKLRDLPEPETVPLEVWVNREQIPLTEPVEVKILPPSAWHCAGHEEVLASFVLKESEAVKDIIKRARAALRCLVKDKRSFEDVLNAHPQAVKMITKAIYFCIQERYEIEYGREPRYYADEWQIVRFPHEVLQCLEGTCIDLALLFAACLENRHLYPVIIIVRTGTDASSGYEIHHALIGCWQDEPKMTQPIEWDGRQVQRWVENGDLLLLDSVGFAHGKQADDLFAICQLKGKKYLDKACAKKNNHDFIYALDICVARHAGFEPMPFGGGLQFDRSAWLAIFRARQEAETLQSPAVGARHLLLGLISLENGLMHQVFAQFGDDMVDKVINLTRVSLPRTGSTRRPLAETVSWKTVMQRVQDTAEQRVDLLITEADLATALLETPSQADRVLASEDLGLTRQQCLDTLLLLIERGTMPSEWHNSGFMTLDINA